MAYKEERSEITDSGDDNLPLMSSTAPIEFKRVRWTKFLQSWPFWAIYIAHFSMNWTNYIIMQWLPTYLTRYLRASKESVSLIAVPLVVNSLFETGEYMPTTKVKDAYCLLSLPSLRTSCRVTAGSRMVNSICEKDHDIYWSFWTWDLHVML